MRIIRTYTLRQIQRVQHMAEWVKATYESLHDTPCNFYTTIFFKECIVIDKKLRIILVRFSDFQKFILLTGKVLFEENREEIRIQTIIEMKRPNL